MHVNTNTFQKMQAQEEIFIHWLKLVNLKITCPLLNATQKGQTEANQWHRHDSKVA